MYSCGQPIVGALLFSLGLYAIIVFKLKLFTGQIGYLPPNLPVILLGNLIGTVFGASLLSECSPTVVAAASKICEQKLEVSLLAIFIKAFFCGILMFVAVEGYKRTKNPLVVLMSIATFILCGFEHCIASLGYFAICGIDNAAAHWRILTMIFGNTIGSLFISLPLLKILDKSNKTDT